MDLPTFEAQETPEARKERVARLREYNNHQIAIIDYCYKMGYVGYHYWKQETDEHKRALEKYSHE